MNENKECNTCENYIFQSTLDGLWYMRVENSHWNEYYDCLDYTEAAINYCCECGKKY